MATRHTDRIRYRYGICLNDNCEKCKSKEVQEIPARKEFVCPECGKPLRECPPPKKGGNTKLLAIIAGVVVLLAIIGCIIAFSGGVKVEKLAFDNSNETLRLGQTKTLTYALESSGGEPQLLWESSDASVVSVTDGTVTANKAGKATIKVSVKGQKDMFATCECLVVETDVDMETLDIQEDPLVLRPGGHQQMTVKFTPEDQNETITWTSSDETIATVSPRGKVEAIKVGAVLIIAKSDRTGVADTANVSVEGPAEMPEESTAEKNTPAPKPAATPAPAPKPAKPAASGSKNLGYATFKGSWPNDVNGRMVFNSSHIIDSKDPKKRVAQAGDYVIGEWSDGHLVQGI